LAASGARGDPVRHLCIKGWQQQADDLVQLQAGRINRRADPGAAFLMSKAAALHAICRRHFGPSAKPVSESRS
jgi:hypothetical protein